MNKMKKKHFKIILFIFFSVILVQKTIINFAPPVLVTLYEIKAKRKYCHKIKVTATVTSVDDPPIVTK
jgi:hypothetical protein